MNIVWPDIQYSAWRDTAATLHLWMQIIGKIWLACRFHST